MIPVRPTHIVTRMSTDMLTVTDPDVAAALGFIRRNPNRLIQVDDVVEATNGIPSRAGETLQGGPAPLRPPGNPEGSRQQYHSACSSART